jgi:hypothetical protein
MRPITILPFMRSSINTMFRIAELYYYCVKVLGGSINRNVMRRRAHCHCLPKPDTVLADE